MIVEHIISISRLTKDLDNVDKESYQVNAALAHVKCQIQPASSEQTAISAGVFGQTYACYTTQSGIMTGDQATVSGTGEVYKVRGIEDWSQIEGIPHYEITLLKAEEEEI